MNRFISNSSRSRAGVTLVELLVAMGAMVAIMGMAYGIYDATRDSSIKLSHRHQAVDYAGLVMSELVLLLEGAIPPDALDGVEPAAAAPIFEIERIAVAGWRNQNPAEGLVLTTIEPAGGAEPGVHYTRHDAPIQIGVEAIGEDRGPQPLGGKNEHFTPEITFSYAAGAVEPGERVDYQPEIAEGVWPRLIQINIFIPLEGKEVVLQTAVIPGRPIGAGAIAARDERAPEVTAEATPAATPRPTPEVTPTASPEPTARPTPTPSPTATPIPPPPLPILPPIRTPRPTATPAATPSPTPPGIKVGGRSGR